MLFKSEITTIIIKQYMLLIIELGTANNVIGEDY